MTLNRPRFDLRALSPQAGVVWLVWLGVLVAGWALLVRPKLQEARELEEQSSPQMQQLAREELRVGKLERFAAALDQAEGDLGQLRAMLATRRQRLIDVQHELDVLATQFRINVASVTCQNELLETEGLERFAMTVPLEGSYGDLRRFLRAVEASSKFLVVEQVALVENKQGGVLLQLNVVLASYFTPEPQAPERASTGA
ncbi:MAG TPA: GspMb/PilO family protein [Candidatus Polarisedimenticolaceae bacterium]|nr:GspMb/PilO family protein [Candidatus Polarisedimenticolaceae bacterium]